MDLTIIVTLIGKVGAIIGVIVLVLQNLRVPHLVSIIKLKMELMCLT